MTYIYNNKPERWPSKEIVYLIIKSTNSGQLETLFVSVWKYTNAFEREKYERQKFKATIVAENPRTRTAYKFNSTKNNNSFNWTKNLDPQRN